MVNDHTQMTQINKYVEIKIHGIEIKFWHLEDWCKTAAM